MYNKLSITDKFQGEVEKVDIVQGYDYTLSFSDTEYCMVCILNLFLYLYDINKEVAPKVNYHQTGTEPS